MLKANGPVKVWLSIVHNPENPRERPEDCCYGEIEIPAGAPIPEVGDAIHHDDEKVPLSDPVIVLTRYFDYRRTSFKDPDDPTAEVIVRLACRFATDEEVGRRIKD